MQIDDRHTAMTQFRIALCGASRKSPKPGHSNIESHGENAADKVKGGAAFKETVPHKEQTKKRLIGTLSTYT